MNRQKQPSEIDISGTSQIKLMGTSILSTFACAVIKGHDGRNLTGSAEAGRHAPLQGLRDLGSQVLPSAALYQ